jgi:cytochrome c55X
MRRTLLSALPVLLAWWPLAPALAQAAEAPAPARQAELVRMVRQDCGSCHGLRLTGGLGPALTPTALRDMPPANLAAVIYHGRPGTPMPGWKTMLSEAEATWIAHQLQAGLAPATATGSP